METHLVVSLIAHAIRAALFLGRRWSMMDPQKYENMTVGEALTSRAGELKVLLEWARTRLDRAASLVALATEPDWPHGGPDSPHERADELRMASRLCQDVTAVFGEQTEPSVTFLVERAFEAEMDALGEEEVDRWNPDRVEGMTVRELAGALDAEKAVTP